jgi:hypothetical protein
MLDPLHTRGKHHGIVIQMPFDNGLRQRAPIICDREQISERLVVPECRIYYVLSTVLSTDR